MTTRYRVTYWATVPITITLDDTDTEHALRHARWEIESGAGEWNFAQTEFDFEPHYEILEG